jgi:hypothetical protein
MKTKTPEASVQRNSLQGESGRFHQRLAANIDHQEGDPPGEQPGDMNAEARESLGNPKNQRDFDHLTSYSARLDVKRGYVTRSERYWKATSNVAEIHGKQEPVDALSRDYQLLDTRIQDAHRLTKFIQN